MRYALMEAWWAEPPKARVGCCTSTLFHTALSPQGQSAWAVAGVLQKPGLVAVEIDYMLLQDSRYVGGVTPRQCMHTPARVCVAISISSTK